jgi:hypothetical protein
MAVKDHKKYLALIEDYVSRLKRAKHDRNEISRYLEHRFNKKVNNDPEVSISDKAYLIQKLIDKLKSILL